MFHSCWEMAKKQPTCTGHCTNGTHIFTPSMREPHMEAQDVLVGRRESPRGGLVKAGDTVDLQTKDSSTGYSKDTFIPHMGKDKTGRICITTASQLKLCDMRNLMLMAYSVTVALYVSALGVWLSDSRYHTQRRVILQCTWGWGRLACAVTSNCWSVPLGQQL